jgi:hypothetical protein
VHAKLEKIVMLEVRPKEIESFVVEGQGIEDGDTRNVIDTARYGRTRTVILTTGDERDHKVICKIELEEPTVIVVERERHIERKTVKSDSGTNK